MPKATSIKPTHKALKKYYAALQSYRDHQVTHEGALETAFQRLLEETAKSHGWRKLLGRSIQKLLLFCRNTPCFCTRPAEKKRRGKWKGDLEDEELKRGLARRKGVRLRFVGLAGRTDPGDVGMRP